MSKDRLKILICISHFLPDKNYGGPVTTIKNLCNCFGSDYDIYILTGCKFFGSKMNYPVQHDTWLKKDNVSIMYNCSLYSKRKELFKLFDNFDFVYCCEIFWKRSLQSALYSRKKHSKVIIATMGGLRPNALVIKRFKKGIFLFGAKLFGLYRNVTWSVSSEDEKDDVQRVFGRKARSIIATDPVVFSPFLLDPKIIKKSNEIKVVFISRIIENKNLLYAIRILSQLTDMQFILDVYGPIEDKQYFDKCVKSAQLYSNIRFKYFGYLESSAVVQTFANYDIFLFPTQTENFGHVIFESLCAGCIPIISDKTPWRDIEESEAGFVCTLNNQQEFADAVKRIGHYSANEMFEAKKRCILYAKKKYDQSMENSGYHLLFKRYS